MRDRMSFAKQMGNMDLFSARGFKVKQRSKRLTPKERQKRKKTPAIIPGGHEIPS